MAELRASEQKRSKMGVQSGSFERVVILFYIQASPRVDIVPGPHKSQARELTKVSSGFTFWKPQI